MIALCPRIMADAVFPSVAVGWSVIRTWLAERVPILTKLNEFKVNRYSGIGKQSMEAAYRMG